MDENMVIELYLSGISVKEICLRCSCGSSKMYSILREHDILFRNERYITSTSKAGDQISRIVSGYESGESIKSISRCTGVGESSIRFALRKLGKKLSLRHEIYLGKSGVRICIVSNLYINEYWSISKIVKEFRVNQNTVVNALKNKGIKLRSPSEQRWCDKGYCRRSWVDGRGYVMVRIGKDSTYSKMERMQSSNCMIVSEHRLIVAHREGRCLENWEQVHHKNHNKQDNKSENLQLFETVTEHNAETLMHKQMLDMKRRIAALEKQIAQKKPAKPQPGQLRLFKEVG